MASANDAPTLTSVHDGSGPQPPSAEALAEQQRLTARKLMQQETERLSLEPVSAQPPPLPWGAGGSRAGARELEERRVISAAIQRGASERRVGGGATASSRLPPAGPSSGTSLQPLRAMRRSTAGGGAATAREPRRAGGLPRAGSAPRARPSGGGGGASHEMEADAVALKRANKLLGAEMRRRSIETDAEVLGHKKLASNLEAELKRLRVEMTRKDGELRRHLTHPNLNPNPNPT